MVYLEKVVKESLRTHPSVPTITRMSSTDIYLKGKFILKEFMWSIFLELIHLIKYILDNLMIPKVTEIALFFSVLGRNPKIWPDPEKFDPDRFDLEESRSRHPFAFSMFSAGPRNCIGNDFYVF